VFTKLSRDHLDYHGTMEEYFQAKLGLFKRPELEFAVINRDDKYGQKIIAELAPSIALWTFSVNLCFKNLEGLDKRSVIAKNICCSINGIEFEVSCGDESATINSRLYGEFNVENMLAVLTTLLALGFSLNEAAAKVSALQSVPGRMEYFGGDNQPVVFVDFAHTPDALEKVLQSVKHHNPNTLEVVFGCGGNRDAGKRPLMGSIAEKLADNIIITDDNPRFEEGEAIVADILSGCENQNLTVIRDRALAIETAIFQAKTGDCVVIAGKGHENYQEIKGVKTPFSDQTIVKNVLENWKK
jgi:UDP-N-acetylmuramoyl-L-alanyl-D-glutamate--2,6-diaminopimelate ligase